MAASVGSSSVPVSCGSDRLAWIHPESRPRDRKRAVSVLPLRGRKAGQRHQGHAGVKRSPPEGVALDARRSNTPAPTRRAKHWVTPPEAVGNPT